MFSQSRAKRRRRKSPLAAFCVPPGREPAVKRGSASPLMNWRWNHPSNASGSGSSRLHRMETEVRLSSAAQFGNAALVTCRRSGERSQRKRLCPRSSKRHKQRGTRTGGHFECAHARAACGTPARPLVPIIGHRILGGLILAGTREKQTLCPREGGAHRGRTRPSP